MTHAKIDDMRFMQLVPSGPRPVEAGESTLPRHRFERAREVPATAIPGTRDRKRAGTIISIAAHLALLFFLLADPPLHTDPNLKELNLGAGGAGPRGGGGGGNHGSGGVRYIKVAPPAPVLPTPPKPQQPVVVMPKLPDPVIPQLEMPKLAAPSPIEVKIQSPVVGIGGGTGNDGTKGNGPGSGGGVGSGIGTGRGSARGPGTGGGFGSIYPPECDEIFLPPLPVPTSVKGFHLIAHFFVDERGKVDSMRFTPTRDGSFNRKIEAILNGMKRWRPGTTLDGKPVRATGEISFTF